NQTPVEELKLIPYDSPEFAAALDIRYRVFVTEQGVPEELERDADDRRAVHALVYRQGRPVGTARLVPRGGAGKIGRVAVLKEARGNRLGVELMRALEGEAARLRLAEVLLDAQVQVIPFYERLGYRAEGDPFLDAGIPHRRMRRRL
ncbi:MAG: GNAT family N-acetyltransferase, partial [Candidatus Eremiobacterota bacterium]